MFVRGDLYIAFHKIKGCIFSNTNTLFLKNYNVKLMFTFIIFLLCAMTFYLVFVKLIDFLEFRVKKSTFRVFCKIKFKIIYLMRRSFIHFTILITLTFTSTTQHRSYSHGFMPDHIIYFGIGRNPHSF